MRTALNNCWGFVKRLAKPDLLLNIAILIYTAYAVKLAKQANQIALDSYRQATKDAQEASRTSEHQQKTLDSSRNALENAVRNAEIQNELLRNSLQTSREQLTMIREQVGLMQDKPDLEAQFFLWLTNGRRLSILVHNRSRSKPAQEPIYEARFYNVGKTYTRLHAFMTPKFGSYKIPPNGYYGPVALGSEHAITPKEDDMEEGGKFFGYVNLHCADCARFRTYWIYFEIGSGGWYREGASMEYNMFLSLDNLNSYVDSFLRSKGLRSLQTQDPSSATKLEKKSAVRFGGNRSSTRHEVSNYPALR